MLWDIRVGSPILPIPGHFQAVISSDFHSDGYQLATSSQDNTVKVFDIRSKNALATIPSHLKLVSDVRYEPQRSRWLISASYDGSIKVHSTRDYTERHSIDCNGQKLSSANVTLDHSYILATSMDKQLMVFSKPQASAYYGESFLTDSGATKSQVPHLTGQNGLEIKASSEGHDSKAIVNELRP